MAPIRPPLPVRNLLLVIVCSLAFLAGLSDDRAEAKPPTNVMQSLVLRIGAHAGYDRLVFDGPRGMAYDVRRDGTKVSVAFSLNATVDLRAASRLKRARAFSARSEDGDGKPQLVVSFDVDPKATLKNFVSGSSIVIDIAGSTGPETDNKAPVTAKTTPAAPETVKPQQDKSTQKAQAPVETSKPMDASSVPNSEPIKTEPRTPSVAAPPVSSPTESSPIMPSLELGTTPVLVATLDPKVVAGTAIFTRGGYGTILFDRKLTLDSSDLTGGVAPRVVLEPLDLPKNNGYRFALPKGSDVQATRNGTVWKIYLIRNTIEPAVSTGFVSQPDFALGARVLLPTADAPAPVRYTDPVVGDDLIVVPLRETSAFSISRRLADFLIIPAAQGLVLKPQHEKVTVRSFAEGVEISAEGGLKLSPVADSNATQRIFKKGPAKFSKSMFDFTLWKGKPNESFTTTRQNLTQTIVDVPDAQRNLARLELARFYFANGMGEETLAILSIVTRQSPDIVSHPEFLALRGAARIWVGRAKEGMNDLNDPALVSQYEIALWQAMGAAQLRDWKTAEEKFSYTEDLWNTYAEPFHSRFAVLAIESALSLNKDREGAEWLDRLEQQPHIAEINPAMKYLRGVLQSKEGHVNEADKLWKDVTRSNDRLYKIRAELALIDLGVATRSLTPLQAIERLEGLRFAWRGDDLELDILHRLGSFYIESDKFKEGLSVLQQAVRLYPNSSLTPPLRAEMAKTFQDLYLTDRGAKLSPVEALTMYQEYRDLIPQGDEGNALKRNLSERLVSIDLLDQAAGLLDEQIKGGLKGEERMRIGARLAAVRLLDHKPDMALAALEISQADLPSGAPAQDLLNERQLLRARALSQQGKYDAALELLQNNDSVAAKMLHADITMRAQRWVEAAKVLLELVGTPPKAGELLSEEQAQWLVSCAIALSLSGDTAGLDRLAIDFGAAMAGTTQKDMFSVLTRPDKAVQMKDIAAAQAKITEVDMFRGFLDTYRKASSDAGKDDKKGK